MSIKELRWLCLTRAMGTRQTHYLLYDHKLDKHIIENANTICDWRRYNIDFIGFPTARVNKLREWGLID